MIEKYSIKKDVGIALSLVGVPIGMYFNQLFPFVKWSPIFMMLSVLLIFSFKNILLKKFYSFNSVFLIIFLFQFIMLFYGVCSSNLTTQYLSFHVYIIFLLSALITNNNDSRSFDNLVTVVFLVSTICSLLGAFFCWKGLVSTDEAWMLAQKGDFYLESFTIAKGSLINFIAAICLKSKVKSFKILVILFILLDIYTLFVCRKRTPIFIAMMSLVVFLYKQGSLDQHLMFRYFKIFIGILILVMVAYFNFELIQTNLDHFIVNFYKGVLNILGDTSVKDSYGSAIMRYNTRVWTYDYIEYEFEFVNYFLGAGYRTCWIDNPILQSYLDMGLVGLFFYLRLVIIYPVRSFFKLKNNLTVFVFLLCIYNVLSSYSSGNPYMYIKYTPIVLLAFVMNLNKGDNYQSN